ncbi:MAG: alpha/beta fold hydrolase [Gammaproteobacteria bacterium]
MSISVELGDTKEVRLLSGTIRYRERGTGEPIVFVHGLLVNGDLWRKVVPELASEFRCITPDWPLGSHDVPASKDADLSPPGIARIVADFIEGIGLDDVTLVGNDTGGGICQLVIANHSEKIGRLVLTNCDAFENFPPGVFKLMPLLARLPGFVTITVRLQNWPPTRNTFFKTLAKHEIEAEILTSYSRPALDAGVRADLSEILKKAAGASRHTLAAAKTFADFRKPVLIAWAPSDRFFAWKYAERLRDAFPMARLERIEDSRTFVPEDQPEKLAELIRAFIHESKEATV